MEYEFLDKVENNTTSRIYSEERKKGDGRVRDPTSWPEDSRQLSKSLRRPNPLKEPDEPYENGQMMDHDQDQEKELVMAYIGNWRDYAHEEEDRCCFLEYEGEAVHVSVLCKGIYFLEKFSKCN